MLIITLTAPSGTITREVYPDKVESQDQAEAIGQEYQVANPSSWVGVFSEGYNTFLKPFSMVVDEVLVRSNRASLDWFKQRWELRRSGKIPIMIQHSRYGAYATK
jgi:hypothetical protein